MIQIPRDIVDAIVRQALAELPNEACGLLAGNEKTVENHFVMANVDSSPEHFSFDPVQQFQVLRTARKAGQKIIASYHSHPSTPARPSQEDIRLAYDPDILYLILSLAEEKPVLKAFRIQNGYGVEDSINLVD